MVGFSLESPVTIRGPISFSPGVAVPPWRSMMSVMWSAAGERPVCSAAQLGEQLQCEA